MNESLEVFPWNENFVTGISRIDEQHKRLVQLLNMLASALVYKTDSIDLNKIFDELAEYAMYHFQTEEGVWHQFLAEDDLEVAHKKSHESFVSEVLKLKTEDINKSLHDVLEDILSFLTKWLAFHILKSDMHMAKIALAVQSGYSLDQAKHQAQHEMSDATEVLIDTVLSMYDSLSNRTLQLMKEIIERQKTERKANALVQRNQLLMQSTPEGIHILDEQGKIIEANNAFCRHLGYTQAEILQLSIFDIEAKLTADELRENMKKLSNGHAQFESMHRRKDGTLVDVEIIFNGVELDGEKCFFALSRDITERKQAEDMIKNLAFYDPLTHLPNRRLLIDRVKQALASCARSGRKSALLFIDLDNFKTLNDTLGHHVGDMLLQHVALRLESCVREGDTVARLGGDEFVVMLEDLGEHDIDAVAQTKAVGEKILQALNLPYQLATHEYHSTPSIGVTLFNNHEQTQDELLKQADIAMYQAKKAGRNTICFFGSAI
jgi:diguanylate cyclase (GGDEF)-like protein/hemerythrin-like metal-binding protein/PAS domain S-box-containing protein